MRSSIALFVLTFVILGLLLGIAASYDAPVEDIPEDREPAIQQKRFEDCIEDARANGALTDDEYFRCAYDVYD